MKKNSLFISFVLVWSVNLFAQDKCSKFYPISERASFTSAVYNTKTDAENKTNKMGEVTYSVDEVFDNAALYTVTVAVNPMPAQQAQYKVSCTDNGVSIDTRAMAGGMTSRFSDAEITGDNIYLPNDLSGPFPLALDDAVMTINSNTAGRAMTMTRSRINRIISRQENIITPASPTSFTCYVLEYDVIMSMNGSTIMTSKTIEWLAADFGVVQSQEFDADGNETSFSWLVEYTR